MSPVTAGGVMKVVKTIAKPLAGIGLAADFYDNATGLASSLQRGEGFAAIPGIVQDVFNGDEAEPEQQSASSGMSNIPAAEGPVNNPDFGKPSVEPSDNSTELSPIQARRSKQTKTDSQPVEVAPSQPPAPQVAPKAPTYNPATDPRNASYIAARDSLTSSSTAEEIKAVEDLGLSLHKQYNPQLSNASDRINRRRSR
jgi:hypothetical protein